MMGIGLQTTRANSIAAQPKVAIEPPSFVKMVDDKIDDGIPSLGNFRATGGFLYGTVTLLTCITGSGQSLAYDLSQTEATCRYIFQVER